MSHDAQLVASLLKTLTVWIPTGVGRYYGGAGEIFNRKIECGRCGGGGHVGKKHRYPCPACDGHGYLLIDQQTRRTESEQDEHKRKDLTVTCDSCSGDGVHRNGHRCHWCDGTGVRAKAQIPLDGPESVQDVLKALTLGRSTFGHVEGTTWLYRQGSYHELDKAMQRLEYENPVAHSIVLLFLVYGSIAVRSTYINHVLNTSCELLATWMPKPIRVPAWAHQPTDQPGKGRWANGYTQSRRNQQIHTLRNQGWKISRIAREQGLSERQVKRVLEPSDPACYRTQPDA